MLKTKRVKKILTNVHLTYIFPLCFKSFFRLPTCPILMENRLIPYKNMRIIWRVFSFIYIPSRALIPINKNNNDDERKAKNT